MVLLPLHRSWGVIIKFAALRFTTQENTVRQDLSTNAGDCTETILDLSKKYNFTILEKEKIVFLLSNLQKKFTVLSLQG